MKKKYTITELNQVSKELIANFTAPKILLFYGEMGVGKTTLIKEIAKHLGVTDKTSSPTFSLVNEYQGKDNTVFHFDFYRIEDETEVYDIGIEDYFYQNAWCLVEWPERIPNIIPENAIKISISKDENELRTLEIENL